LSRPGFFTALTLGTVIRVGNDVKAFRGYWIPADRATASVFPIVILEAWFPGDKPGATAVVAAHSADTGDEKLPDFIEGRVLGTLQHPQAADTREHLCRPAHLHVLATRAKQLHLGVRRFHRLCLTACDLFRAPLHRIASSPQPQPPPEGRLNLAQYSE
jgi:hypothetical protein